VIGSRALGLRAPVCSPNETSEPRNWFSACGCRDSNHRERGYASFGHGSCVRDGPRSGRLLRGTAGSSRAARTSGRTGAPRVRRGKRVRREKKATKAIPGKTQLLRRPKRRNDPDRYPLNHRTSSVALPDSRKAAGESGFCGLSWAGRSRPPHGSPALRKATSSKTKTRREGRGIANIHSDEYWQLKWKSLLASAQFLTLEPVANRAASLQSVPQQGSPAQLRARPPPRNPIFMNSLQI
jgi:hypothetical protein